MDGFTKEDRERLINTAISISRLEQQVSDFISTTQNYISERDKECSDIRIKLQEIDSFIQTRSSWLGGAKYIMSLVGIGFIAVVPHIVFYIKQYLIFGK